MTVDHFDLSVLKIVLPPVLQYYRNIGAAVFFFGQQMSVFTLYPDS